jgi:hypothetical protein
MSLAADKSAAEGRWVKFSEIIEQVYCASPTECSLLANSDAFPEGWFKPQNIQDLSKIVVPVANKVQKGGSIMDKFKEMVGI